MPLTPDFDGRLKKLELLKSDKFCSEARYMEELATNKVRPQPLTFESCIISQENYLATLATITNDKKLSKLVNAALGGIKERKYARSGQAAYVVGQEMHKAANELMTNPTYSGYLDPDAAGVAFYCRTIMSLISHPLVDGWNVVRYLGGGSFGKALLIMNPSGARRVIKIAVEDSSNDYLNVREETEMQRVFHEAGIAPRVHGSYTKKIGGKHSVSVIVMDPVDYTLKEMLCLVEYSGHKKTVADARVKYLAGLLMDAILAMRRAGLTHGDMHDTNVGVLVDANNKVKKVVFIDFGQSSSKIHYPKVDMEQMLRVLAWDYPRTRIFANIFQKFLDDSGSDYQLEGTDYRWNSIKQFEYDQHVGFDDKRRRVERLRDIKDAFAVAGLLGALQRARLGEQKRSPSPRRRGRRRSPRPRKARKSPSPRRGRRGSPRPRKARKSPRRGSPSPRRGLTWFELQGGAARQSAFVSGPARDPDPRGRPNKPCKDGWERNPDTRRCRKMDADKEYEGEGGVVIQAEGALRRERRGCGEGYTYNVASRRCVKDLAVRRQLIPCGHGRRRHRGTMRCRLHDNVPDADVYTDAYAHSPLGAAPVQPGEEHPAAPVQPGEDLPDLDFLDLLDLGFLDPNEPPLDQDQGQAHGAGAAAGAGFGHGFNLMDPPPPPSPDQVEAATERAWDAKTLAEHNSYIAGSESYSGDERKEAARNARLYANQAKFEATSARQLANSLSLTDSFNEVDAVANLAGTYAINAEELAEDALTAVKHLLTNVEVLHFPVAV
jgi:hypothetical protein